MWVHSEQEAACPICHNSFTDTNVFSIEELLADYPIWIKYCGHIVGKLYLKQWMDVSKIDGVKHPYRTCPLCHVQIEGGPVPAIPAILHDHRKKDIKARMNRRKLEEMRGSELEIEECFDAISACMSEEIAAENLLAQISRKAEQKDRKVEVHKSYLRGSLERLRMERWAWGFRGIFCGKR